MEEHSSGDQLTETFIRMMVALEVQKQVNPILAEVNDIGKRLRSFYSNGSGGPPGALEIWRAEDEKKFESIDSAIAVGQANSEVFLKFISAQQTKEANWKKWRGRAWDFAKWAGPIAGTAVLGLSTLIYHKAAPVFHIIIDDYIQAHPQVHEKLKQQHTISESPTQPTKPTTAKDE